MQSARDKKFTQGLIIFGVIGVTLFITPSYSNEPIDLPKLFLLGLTSFAILGFLLNAYRSFTKEIDRRALVLVSLFLLLLTLVLIFSGANFNEQFFGTQGRNTGYLAYFSLSILLIASSLISDEIFTKRLTFSLLATGAISAGYGLLQTFGHDPIKWNNGYNPIIAFVGNPDFASSFIGFSSAAVVALICYNKISLKIRLLLSSYLLFATFIIWRSHAQQGLLVLGFSAIVAIYFALRQSVSIHRSISWIFVAISISISTIVVLGIFKIGPLASHLYKYSVRQRGFYWNAALSMMKSNPIFGVGLDSFGNNYYRYRSAKTAALSADVQTNAAHNVFLDIGSTGGIALFLIFVALNLYILFKGLQYLLKSKSYDPFFTAIFAAWIGYQAESLISINQIGLGIWGWVFSGTIIGYVYKSEKIKSVIPQAKTNRLRIRNKSGSLISPAISFAFGVLIFTPAFVADHNYRVALASQNAQNLINVTKQYPESIGRDLNTAQLLIQNKLMPQGIEILDHVVKVDEKNYNAWSLLAQVSPENSLERKRAISKMRELNPHDSRIK